jgi:hypothetical protein
MLLSVLNIDAGLLFSQQRLILLKILKVMFFFVHILLKNRKQDLLFTGMFFILVTDRIKTK